MAQVEFLSTGRDHISFQAMQYRLSVDPSVRGAIPLSVHPTRIRIPFRRGLDFRRSVSWQYNIGKMMNDDCCQPSKHSSWREPPFVVLGMIIE